MMAFGIDDAVAAGLKVLDKFIPDPGAKAQAEKELRDSLTAWDIAQIDVNKVEAANPNVWVSGARPALLWICAVGFAWHYILYPALFFLGSVFHVTGMPTKSGIDGGLFELAIALLGLGGLRTYEKIKGVARI
jgi:hypothetical protein